jgi:hypothetical protein
MRRPPSLGEVRVPLSLPVFRTGNSFPAFSDLSSQWSGNSEKLVQETEPY